MEGKWTEKIIMFDLNDGNFGGIQIFNDGEAGLVKNVEISVEKRGVDEPDSYPDYKLLATDSSGATVNQGFYYFKPNDQRSEEENNKSEKILVGRVLSIAKAVMGKDYKFPVLNTSKEVMDTLFKLIKDNAVGKKFNVFVTYGNDYKPSAYLSFRFFDFIEPYNGEESSLKMKKGDLMERPEADNDPTEDELSSNQKSIIDEF